MKDLLGFAANLAGAICLLVSSTFAILLVIRWLDDLLGKKFQFKGMTSSVLAVSIVFGSISVVCFIAGKMVSV